ncbi:hypothetical protein BHM03_00029768 [Ensete ventricosum]|nr:hypothetical protein BHM03_00029768 [Ensete ventricosum]
MGSKTVFRIGGHNSDSEIVYDNFSAMGLNRSHTRSTHGLSDNDGNLCRSEVVTDVRLEESFSNWGRNSDSEIV